MRNPFTNHPTGCVLERQGQCETIYFTHNGGESGYIYASARGGQSNWQVCHGLKQRGIALYLNPGQSLAKLLWREYRRN